MTMSPERSSIDIGSASRVRPPIKKIAAQPKLHKNLNLCIMHPELNRTYEIDTRGVVVQTSDRSTCAMSVSCVELTNDQELQKTCSPSSDKSLQFLHPVLHRNLSSQ
jgi:hypothetical protein